MNLTQKSTPIRWKLLLSLLILALLTPYAAFADEPIGTQDPALDAKEQKVTPTVFDADKPILTEDPALDTKEQKVAPTAFAADKPVPEYSWGAGTGKSYLIPALDITGFFLLLNQYDRQFIDSEVYGSDLNSFEDNLTGKWVYDSDPFETNQFMHPYAGSMYHGFARSAGLDYWTALGYSAAGSLLWELAGETSAPSINDEYTTGYGGTILGEPLFRMASLLLESSEGKPNVWRELGAAAMSPSTGFNRLAYGKRFRGVFRSNNPAVYTRLQLGVNMKASVRSNVNRNPITGVDQETIPQSYKNGEPIADIYVSYGLPGKPGYTYDRPFDYFNFQLTATPNNAFENIISRGLLYGTDYALGDNYRGIWGVYGTYDYIVPQIFRVSTTAVGLGTTAQMWLSEKVALQGTVLAGVGYGSAGTIHGEGERDYHNGISPQGMLEGRLIFADRAALDLELREYYISGTASDEIDGSENILRGVGSLTVRVFNLHGITFRYTVSRRDAQYSGLADTSQTVNTVSIGYTYLGQTRFGAVDWRSKSKGGPN